MVKEIKIQNYKSVQDLTLELGGIYYADNIKSKSNNCDFKLHEKAGKFEKNPMITIKFRENIVNQKLC